MSLASLLSFVHVPSSFQVEVLSLTKNLHEESWTTLDDIHIWWVSEEYASQL